jgi:hypothetical protein
MVSNALREARLSAVCQSRADGSDGCFEVARHGTAAATPLATRAAPVAGWGDVVLYDLTS